MAADLDTAQLSPAVVLSDLHSCIDRLQALDPAAWSAEELVEALRETERAARRLPVVRGGLVAEVQARGLPAARVPVDGGVPAGAAALFGGGGGVVAGAGRRPGPWSILVDR
jgi:hypothetical protein